MIAIVCLKCVFVGKRTQKLSNLPGRTFFLPQNLNILRPHNSKSNDFPNKMVGVQIIYVFYCARLFFFIFFSIPFSQFLLFLFFLLPYYFSCYVFFPLHIAFRMALAVSTETKLQEREEISLKQIKMLIKILYSFHSFLAFCWHSDVGFQCSINDIESPCMMVCARTPCRPNIVS